MTAPPVLVAALGPAMLKLAGTVADGTITWMTGTATVGIAHRADDHGRGQPRAGRRPGSSCPCRSRSRPTWTARERINEAFSIYPNLPSYKAMLDKEGAAAAADIGFVGDEEAVAASIAPLADAGATDFVAPIVGDAEERDRGFALLGELARS